METESVRSSVKKEKKQHQIILSSGFTHRYLEYQTEIQSQKGLLVIGQSQNFPL